MLPCLPIPRSVTVLYVFAVVNLTALLNLTLVDANLIVLDKYNTTIEELSDLPASFGPRIPPEGIWGHIQLAEPHDACERIHPPEPSQNSSIKWMALIRRKGCDFDLKVLNAQKAGYSAAIIHNIDSDKLDTMVGNKYAKQVHIYSILISATDGIWLEKLLKEKEIFSVIIDPRKPLDANLYLLPFAIVVGICFVVMVVFMIAKWILNIRRRRRSRLSKANLKKIPIKKFVKGDPYDVCAICLDEYEEGEKLRVLPCSHAYHQKCVDPWLTKNKRTCPLCKKKVIPGEPDTSSEEESEDEESGPPGDSETTPLLASNNNRPGRRARGGNTFENSGLPAAVRNEVRPVPGTDSDSSSLDDGYSATPSTSVHQSSVEVHQTPRLHRHSPQRQNNTDALLFGPSPSGERAEKISVGSQTSGDFAGFGGGERRAAGSDSSSSYSSSLEGDDCEEAMEDLAASNSSRPTAEEQQMGAVGGQPNLAFELVEDYFNLDSGNRRKGRKDRRKKRRPSPSREEIEVRVVVGKGNIQEGDEDDRLPPV